MRYKRFGLLAMAFALAISSFGGVGFVPNAYAVAKTWTGAGGNGNFSTAANWSDNSAPVDGDSLNFSVASISTDTTVTNDLTGLSVVGIAFSGAATDYDNFTIAGSAITVTGPISNASTYNSVALLHEISAPLVLGANVTLTDVNFTGSVITAGHALSINSSSSMVCGLNILGTISGAGAVTIASAVNSGVNVYGDNSGFTGTFSVSTGSNVGFAKTTALGQATSLTSTGANVVVGLDGANRSLSTLLNMSGKLVANRYQGTAWACGGGGAPDTTKYTLTLAGGLSLNGDLEYNAYYVDTVVSDPYTVNGHQVTVKAGSNGDITLPTGAIDTPAVTNEYNDDMPSEYVYVGNKQTAIINGVRGGVAVTNGGLLKGTGTVDSLSVSVGGIVAPGLSPGTLTVVNNLYLDTGSAFEAEIQSVDAYDQIAVTTGDVQLNDATLRAIAYDGISVDAGDVFTIVDKQSAGAVTGAFLDLPEGATFSFGVGGVLRISYVGGDGNDITLTVVNAPTAPDTGFALIKANPIMMIIAAGAAVMLALMARSLVAKRR